MKNNKIVSKESDEDKIKSLAKILTKYNLTAVEIFEDGKKYRVEKSIEEILELSQNTSAILKNAGEKIDTIFSPMAGVFHDALPANESPLMQVGQRFKKGDTLCIIEIVKTFTEVRADENGTIKEICAKNGDLIEYSQPLFKYIKQ